MYAAVTMLNAMESFLPKNRDRGPFDTAGLDQCNELYASVETLNETLERPWQQEILAGFERDVSVFLWLPMTMIAGAACIGTSLVNAMITLVNIIRRHIKAGRKR
jgi:hypothetical protein